MLQSFLLIVAGTLAVAVDAPARPDEKPPARVGQIIIVGNEVIPNGIILDSLPLYPGQILTYPDLRAAERKLSWLQMLGIGSTVAIIDLHGPNPYKDILVTVQETTLTRVLIGIPDNIVSLLRGP